VTDPTRLLALADECGTCRGLGWVGTARAEQFANMLELARAGALPTRKCPECNGTGGAVLRARAEEASDGE